MPAGQVIGRVAIRVLPDTDGFRRQAERQLETIEQQLDKLKVGTKIDMSGASKAFIEELRKINSRNRQSDARKIRFYTTISTDGMATAIRNAARELQHRANSQKIDFKVNDLKATGKVELDLDQQSADHVKRKLNDWASDVSPLKVMVELDIANGAGAAVSARLQVLTRPRTVPILPELDNGAVARVGTALAALSGARVINSIFEKLGNTLKNLDKNVPIIGSLAVAISGLAAWGLSAASNLAALSASLAQIGYAGLLLPGLLGGMVVGLGITIAAFKDFNKVIPEVKSALAGLQDTISTNFWAQAEQPIRAMVDDLLPRFRTGVADTATALGGFFGSLATNLGTSLSPALDQMFRDLSQSIANATQGTDTFASIIATLGKVGTSYLPQLATWFVSISEKFDGFLQRKGENGLKAEIDQGIQSLKDLGSVLYNTGGILAGIARAAEAAGGSSLGMLAGTLERIHSTVDSAGFQEGLTGVFRAAHEAMSQIASTSGPAVKNLFAEFAQLAETILPQVGGIIGTALNAIASALAQPAVTDGIRAMFNGIGSAVADLAPAMAPVGQALGALMQVVGAFAAMLGPLVAAVITPLATAFTALAPAIIPIVNLLGTLLTAAVQAVAPLVVQLAEGLQPIISAMAEGLAPIIPVVSAALQTVAAALSPLIEVALQLLEAVIKPLIPVITEIVAAVLPPLADALARVAEAVTPLLEVLTAVVDFLMPILAPAIVFIAKLLGDALTQAINGVAMVFEGALKMIKGVWDIFAGIFTGDWERVWNGIKSFVSGIWEWIKGAFLILINIGILGVGKKILGLFKGLWEGSWTGIKSLSSSIWNGIKGLWNGFLDLLGSLGRSAMSGLRTLWDDAWNAIKSKASSIWSGIKGLWNSFLDTLKSLGSSAMSGLKSLWDDAWNGIKTLCSRAWDGIKDAVKDGTLTVVRTVSELPGKAKSVLSGIGSALIDAGKKLIGGLIDGIKSMFGSVKDTLGGLTSKFKDWKGPPKKDKILLYEAGQIIIKGLIKGLESQYGKVKDSLQNLTSQIPKDASQGLRDRIARDRTQLLKLAAQWEAGSKRLEAARDKLVQLRKQAQDYAGRVVDRIIDTGDVTKAKDGSFGGIVTNLTQAVDQAKRFAKALAVLKAKGLSQTAIDQIATAGPEAGLTAAESIAAAGKDGIAKINALQAQLAKYAKQAGKTASDAMYANGIAVAEGIVKGLEVKQQDIEKQMLKIADAMVDAIKKALGIHSPSRVFATLGGYIGQGLAQGIAAERPRVARAVDDLVDTGTVTRPSAVRGLSAAVGRALAAPPATSGTTKILNYYAAPGNSLSSQEDLFAAASRARMVGW
ncbi:hypothetical protein ACIA8F_23540 [Streptomyces sp. NPDC051563]|uniref:hypothetical protein n=1 Tax=Streptomyces sp. NPDC051563 TaxID=3365659 RepID=UPI0037B7FA4C